MPNPEHLPHLLRLLEDTSQEVRRVVLKELQAFGPRLREELEQLPQRPSVHQRELLEECLQKSARQELRETWPGWFEMKDDKQRLEKAFTLLSRFQNGLDATGNLKSLLDGLAEEYKENYEQSSPEQLSRFLFQDKGFRGAQDDYYNPQNSNLAHVIQSQRGIPISLASIYILVGARLQLNIEGCNMPGHFLARFESDRKKVLVDCFNSGKIVDKEDVALLNVPQTKNLPEVLDEEVAPEIIIRRVLNNLILAYRKRGEHANSRLMKDLRRQVSELIEQHVRLTEKDMKRLLQGPKFRIGQLVKHKRYGYRGVIVDFDFSCQADEEWYYSNKTQPKVEQPWYHVLVDGSNQVTYAAQSSVLTDPSAREVDHPLIPHFFDSFQGEGYVRNSRPWPRW